MNPRRLFALAAVAAAVCLGCGDDGGDPIDAASSIDATATPDSAVIDSAVIDSAPDIDADPAAPDADTTDAPGPDSMVGDPPVISMVAWAPDGSCSNGVSSGMIITVTASDTETATGSLLYSGSVGGCTGSINAAMVTLTCPQAAPYSGSVTVTDGDGNTDNQGFSFGPCETGSVTP